MSARCLSLAWRRSALFSSWMYQDPLLVLRMAAVPERRGRSSNKGRLTIVSKKQELNSFYTETRMTYMSPDNVDEKEERN